MRREVHMLSVLQHPTARIGCLPLWKAGCDKQTVLIHKPIFFLPSLTITVVLYKMMLNPLRLSPLSP